MELKFLILSAIVIAAMVMFCTGEGAAAVNRFMQDYERRTRSLLAALAMLWCAVRFSRRRTK